MNSPSMGDILVGMTEDLKLVDDPLFDLLYSPGRTPEQQAKIELLTSMVDSFEGRIKRISPTYDDDLQCWIIWRNGELIYSYEDGTREVVTVLKPRPRLVIDLGDGFDLAQGNDFSITIRLIEDERSPRVRPQPGSGSTYFTDDTLRILQLVAKAVDR